MKINKITDRFWLGVISGLGGNLVKTAIEEFFKRKGVIKSTAIEKASGIFVDKKDISSPQGRMVGFIADNMIAGALGVSCVYWLTLMGRDKYLLKGGFLGAIEWTTIYGVLSRAGATSIFPVKPADALVGFVSHFAFGMTKIALSANLGDTRLFQPKNLAFQPDEPQELLNNNRPLPVKKTVR